jgi:transcription elongation GreA/GreB family factor
VSKAFTKEDDGTTAPPVARKRGVPVPELNMVTPRGLAAARAELEELTRTNGDADRVHELVAHLATAQAVEPPADRGEVGLGAAVVVEAESGKRTSYRIVGAIEADPRRGALSWQSPLAERLHGARVGDAIELPNGDEVTIVSVAYD